MVADAELTRSIARFLGFDPENMTHAQRGLVQRAIVSGREKFNNPPPLTDEFRRMLAEITDQPLVVDHTVE